MDTAGFGEAPPFGYCPTKREQSLKKPQGSELLAFRTWWPEPLGSAMPGKFQLRSQSVGGFREPRSDCGTPRRLIAFCAFITSALGVESKGTKNGFVVVPDVFSAPVWLSTRLEHLHNELSQAAGKRWAVKWSKTRDWGRWCMAHLWLFSPCINCHFACLKPGHPGRLCLLVQL